jgi:hypothetical protein
MLQGTGDKHENNPRNDSIALSPSHSRARLHGPFWRAVRLLRKWNRADLEFFALVALALTAGTLLKPVEWVYDRWRDFR